VGGFLPPAAARIVSALGLERVYEGVYLKRVYESAAAIGRRPAATAAYVLAAWNAPSRPHRLDCDELWHFCAGQALGLYIFDRGGVTTRILGPDTAQGENPLIALPRGTVFGAAVAAPDGWCLCGCTCVPGFQPGGCEFFGEDSPALASFAGHRELIRRLSGG
jgi:predicted cupin superfamily sugar epimerase